MLFVALALPALGLIAAIFMEELGANPVEKLTHETGEWALRILILTLLITPLRRLSGWNWLIRLRRMCGLYAFFYAALHFTVYLWLDQFFDLSAIVEDIVKRPYITVGFTAVVLMVPLAITSMDSMVRRLGGKRWRNLHRLAYVCGLLGCLHYLWLVKADLTEPLIYTAVLVVALLARLNFRRARA
jgi:methionine sulfoxide reductase heme-binding subunit